MSYEPVIRILSDVQKYRKQMKVGRDRLPRWAEVEAKELIVAEYFQHIALPRYSLVLYHYVLLAVGRKRAFHVLIQEIDDYSYGG